MDNSHYLNGYSGDHLNIKVRLRLMHNRLINRDPALSQAITLTPDSDRKVLCAHAAVLSKCGAPSPLRALTILQLPRYFRFHGTSPITLVLRLVSQRESGQVLEFERNLLMFCIKDGPILARLEELQIRTRRLSGFVEALKRTIIGPLSPSVST